MIAQPKSMFSYALTVMDKVEGWIEEQWVGARLAACMWIYTVCVLCEGQESTQEYLKPRFVVIRESDSWVCEDAMKDDEWVTELTVTLRNPVEMLWFSSPSRLNQRFTDNGSKIAKHHEVINMAIEATFTLPFGVSYTPRTCLLRSVSVVLYRSPDKDWDVGPTTCLMHESA